MPAQSQQQQKLFGLALSVKRGETPRSEASQDVLDIVDSMSEKDIKDFAGTEHSGLPKKVESQLRSVYREVIRERVLSEAAGKEAMGIAAFTGTRGDAVQKFIDDNKLDAKKLFNYVKGGKLTDRLNFVTAIVGTPGNPVQKKLIKMFGESVNEDTKKRFDVDFYKIMGDRQTSHEEIIRGDKFSDVISQATKVAKSKGMNYVEFYHRDAFIGSIDKKSNYTFKKGRNSEKSPLPVTEEKYPIAIEKFNKELIKHPMVKKAAQHYKKTPAEIVKVLQQRLYTKGDKTGNTKEVWIDFKDTTSGITIKHKMKFNESVNEADVVGKTVFSDGKGKLFFGYYKTDDAVEFVDYKTWKKLNFKDVSKGDTNKDRVIASILRNQKQFNKKVDYNMWAKKTNPSFEQKMDWFIQNGWISNINKGGIKESTDSVNEASYNFGKETYTRKNLTPTQILDLAMGYVQTPITKLVGKTLGHRVNVANDLSNLTGTTQLDATKRGKSPALVLFLLKNSLVTKDEYVKLYKDLVAKHQQVIKYLKNASPEMRGAGGAARAAAKDMKGEFEMESKDEN